MLYADLNNDFVLDQIHSLVGWEPDYRSFGLSKTVDEIACTAVVLSGKKNKSILLFSFYIIFHSKIFSENKK